MVQNVNSWCPCIDERGPSWTYSSGQIQARHECLDVVDCGIVPASRVSRTINTSQATKLDRRRQLRSHRCAFIQSKSHFTFLPCAVMAKRYLLVYLIISIIFTMFACVKGCPFMGKSVCALSAHQRKCDAHQRDVAHSERGKQRRAIVQQQRNHPKTSGVSQFFHLFGISNLRNIVSPALPWQCPSIGWLLVWRK